MSYVIDARLEQSEPELRLVETPSGRCCCEWRGEALCRMLDAAGLCPRDFCSADPGNVKELVRTLFLSSAAEASDIPAMAAHRARQRRSWVVVQFPRPR